MQILFKQTICAEEQAELILPRAHMSERTFSYIEARIHEHSFVLLEFVFIQKHQCLPRFRYHIVLHIQRTFILSNEIPRETTQKV